MLGADYWDASGSGIVAMMKIMDTVGSDTWEGLKGMYCRVEFTEDGTMIQKIGHLLEDKWFDVRSFFEQDDGHAIYVLDERKCAEDSDDDDMDDEWHDVYSTNDDYFR